MTGPSDEQEPSWAPPADGDEVVESGAIIRSSAETTSDPEQAAQTRWPWESDAAHTDTPGKVQAGPTVSTSDLYRNDGGTPDTTTAVGKSSVSDPTGSANFAQPPVTLAPMTSTYAVGAQSAEDEIPVSAPKSQRGLGSWGVFFLICGITTVVGLVDMTVNREFTLMTGVSFVAASVIGALIIRPSDLSMAVIAPPIAFLIALLIAGQPSTLSGSGSLLVREASLLGTGLAFNAPFIFGGTAAALVIVLIRGASRRSKNPA